MNLKFWEKISISATDVERINKANIEAQDIIAKLEEYHKLLCPLVKVDDFCYHDHNKVLSDAIEERIKSIRDKQARTALI